MTRKISLSPSELVRRFDETVAWCSLKRLTSEARYDGLFLSQKLREEKWSESELQPHLILTDQLRSPALKPTVQEPLQPLSQWVSNVEEVAAKRSQQFKGIGREATSQPKQQRGQLLVYAPEDNLCDGAAQVQSLGFFDVDNVPPWDTWVAMEGKYLLAWVPPQMLKFASAGVEVNPEECIKWADDPLLSYQQIGKAVRAMLGTES